MKRLLGVVGLLLLVGGILFLVPSDHYLFLPDPARPVDPLVRVPGETQEPDREGNGIYMVDILVRKANLLERLVPEVQEGASLAPPEAVNPVGVSEEARREESLNEMSRSQAVAVTVGLRELGYRVPVERTGAEVVTVVPGQPAEGKLQIGDVIVEARGERVRSSDELRQAMEPVQPGQTVDVVVDREGKRLPLRVDTVESEDGERAVFGVIVEQAAAFDFPVDVEIDAGDVGGPSAGLAFALDVVDELGEDIDRGRRVAVTGTIDLEGDVGPIGGIKQKVIGARRAGADLFLVPDRNAAEARKNADGLRIVPVTTFDEALAALEAR